MIRTGIVALQSALLVIALSACGVNDSPQTTTNSNDNDEQTNNFSLVANGEDFIRQGFVSKDGWRIDFDRVDVTLARVTAYQTNPPFNPDEEGELQASESVVLVEEPTTIDLARGDENAEPITVTEVSAPNGSYNAIEWSIVNDPEQNASIILDGVATKDGRTVDFLISFPTELNYLCGEFIGDERKGILEDNQTAELETTFHFDHLFGDGEAPADDEINVGALGFEPLAVIAGNNDNLQIDLATLEQQLSPGDYDKLIDNLQSLGHVGEGHCRLQNQG